MSQFMKAHNRSVEQHAIDAVEATKNANVDAGRHAERIHRMTLGGIILTGTLSLGSVLVACYALHAQPKQAPAASEYQEQMEKVTQQQLIATRQQTEALGRLSQTLIDTQKRAAVAQQKVVVAAVELSKH